MAILSLSRWPVIADGNSSQLVTILVPGTSKRVKLQKDVAPVFAAFLSEWHKTVHSIDYPGALGPDGWEYRVARLGGGWSNHSAAVACDITYDWLKADHQRHMNTTEIAAVNRLLDKYVTADGRRIFGWGGDWKVGTACDEMHVESVQGWSPGARGIYATAADFKAVQTRLGINADGTFAPKPNPAPVPPIHVKAVPAFPGPFGLGASGAHVKAVQLGVGVTADGKFGPITLAAVKKYQRPRPWLWPADGVVGKLTYRGCAKPI